MSSMLSSMPCSNFPRNESTFWPPVWLSLTVSVWEELSFEQIWHGRKTVKREFSLPSLNTYYLTLSSRIQCKLLGLTCQWSTWFESIFQGRYLTQKIPVYQSSLTKAHWVYGAREQEGMWSILSFLCLVTKQHCLSTSPAKWHHTNMLCSAYLSGSGRGILKWPHRSPEAA